MSDTFLEYDQLLNDGFEFPLMYDCKGKDPWCGLYPKQMQLLEMGREPDGKRYHPDCPAIILVDGARKASKSIAVGMRVLLHMWETPGARVALVVKTVKSATDGGIWMDIHEILLPLWRASKFKVQYTTFDRQGEPGPKTDSKTRTIYFRMNNAYRGQSEMRLMSLDHDKDAEEKLKSQRWSCVWFSELSNFKDMCVFRASYMQLRREHLKRWQHLWIADTNPPEEGEDSWIYKFWYLREATAAKVKTEEETPELKSRREAEDNALRKGVKRLTFFLEDNPSVSKEEALIQGATYNDDPGEYARNMNGVYVKGHGNRGKHFADVFSRNFHVIGGGPDEGDQIDVDPRTNLLFGGWDIGEVNHGCGCLERKLLNVEGREVTTWNILDSFLALGEQIEITEIAHTMVAKMDAIELAYRRTFEWRHWSDDSALNVFRASSGTFDYLLIQIATKGRVVLQGAYKPENSVRARVRLVRNLLRQGRLYVSARCTDVIDMLENCNESSDFYVARNRWKHTFDWISYVLIMEEIDELYAQSIRPNARAMEKMRLMSFR